MKIKLVKNRRKQEIGISWTDEEIIGICHNFVTEEPPCTCAGCRKERGEPATLHIKTLDVSVKCRKKVYIEV